MSLNKPVKISILAALVVLLGVGAFWFFNRSGDTAQNEDSINYGPPTETEISETDQHKEELAEELSEDEENGNQSGDNADKRSVTPIISFWGQQPEGSDLEVNGYVPGIVEKNGSCTATLTRSNETVEETKLALDDAQTTSCGLIVIPRSELSAGDWSLSLRYESPYSAGLSETVTVTIN